MTSSSSPDPNGDLAGLRQDYRLGELADDAITSWHEQLFDWLREAHEFGIVDANAMVLATASSDELATRTVLAKRIDDRGVCFFTNYSSEKSKHLIGRRQAAATFPWLAMQRQVSLRGPVERVSEEESDSYWLTRPRGSQLGAWASAQSTTASTREAVDSALSEAEKRFVADAEIPRPAHWGGWRLRPQVVEFWQGRSNRMHDRIRLTASPDGAAADAWVATRLFP